MRIWVLGIRVTFSQTRLAVPIAAAAVHAVRATRKSFSRRSFDGGDLAGRRHAAGARVAAARVDELFAGLPVAAPSGARRAPWTPRPVRSEGGCERLFTPLERLF